MDNKEKQMFDYYYTKIYSNQFDEKDIYSFLILIRNQAEKNSPVLEFADFIAHRDKERGYIRDYLLESKTKLDQIANNNIPKGGFILEIKEVFSHEEIKKSFNSILKRNGCKIFSSNTINNIILCIISLLQNVKIYSKKGKYLGDLTFSISKKQIVLLGKVEIQNKAGVYTAFPALSVDNIYVETAPADEWDTPVELIKVIEIINEDGKLKINPTEYES